MTSKEEAEHVAIQALQHLAGEPELLSRFVALTGIEPAALRQAAREPGFLAGVLDFYLGHEPTLLAFCDDAGFAGEMIGNARQALAGRERDHND